MSSQRGFLVYAGPASPTRRVLAHADQRSGLDACVWWRRDGEGRWLVVGWWVGGVACGRVWMVRWGGVDGGTCCPRAYAAVCGSSGSCVCGWAGVVVGGRVVAAALRLVYPPRTEPTHLCCIGPMLRPVKATDQQLESSM